MSVGTSRSRLNAVLAVVITVAALAVLPGTGDAAGAQAAGPAAAQPSSPDSTDVRPGRMRQLIASPDRAHTRVGRPDFTPPGKASIASATLVPATIHVTYTGFTPEAEAAFQAAVNVWATLISSSQVIEIEATWEALGANVLGQAGPTTFYRNQPGMVAGTWYPIALANALGNTDIRTDLSDIQASFNSNFSNWYLGTDGNPGATQYDLTSVVMHEIGHGLGFLDTFWWDAGNGMWGFDCCAPLNPDPYDKGVQNGAGQSLLNEALFPQNSAALGSQLVSNDIYMASTGALRGNRGAKARLYAPTTWSGGSSIAHLDDATFPAGNPNSLMTHAISQDEAIHAPGPITLGILRDAGWTTLQVPVASTAPAATAGNGTAAVTWSAPSDTGGTPVTGYTVTPFVGSAPQTPTTVGNVLSTTVTGLTNGTAYTFKVAATNAIGQGPDSPASNAVTPTASGAISGSVRNTSNAAIPKICVAALNAATGAVVSSTSTGAAGTYSLPLPAGSYKLKAASCGAGNWVTEYFDDQVELGPATTVVVTNGATSTANFVMAWGGALSGTATYKAASPAFPACAYAYDSAGRFRGLGPTNASGAFAIPSLPVGAIKVRLFKTTSGCTSPSPNVFYIGAPDFATANTVNIAAGATTTGVNVKLVYADGDTNGDSGADFALFRESSGQFLTRSQSTVPLGQSGDLPIRGDFDGDGDADPALFRPSSRQWLANGAVSVWGQAGDLPVPGDYNGDRITDRAVFRPSTGEWLVDGGATIAWGQIGDKPVPADYNGDGVTDLAVFRPSNGLWYVRNVNVFQWGQSGDIPVPADYNGDRRADVAYYRPSTGEWSIRGQFSAIYGGGTGSGAADKPVPADFNRDGITDIAIYRPATGYWYVRNLSVTQFGASGDKPVIARS